MSEIIQLCFDAELLQHINNGENNEAISMLDESFLNARDNFGTLLHYTAIHDNATLAQHLIAFGIAIDSLGEDDKTSLMIAVDYQCLRTIKVLLESGASIDIKDVTGQNAISMAFRTKDINFDIIKLFYDKLRTESKTTEDLVDRLSIAGCTLQQAVRLHAIKVLEGLLERGYDVNSRDHTQRSALEIATEINDLDMVKLLVNYKVDVNSLDENENGILYYAAKSANVAMMKILLEHGANPNTKDCNTEITPLYEIFNLQVRDRNHINVERIDACAAILLQHGAVPQNPRSDYIGILNIPLHWPKSNGIIYLIAHFAFLNTIGIPPSPNIVNYQYVNDVNDQTIIAKLEKYYELCQEILKIRVYIKKSLLDLLRISEYQMRLYVRNETFVCKILESCVQYDFKMVYFYYYDWLMNRIDKAVYMVRLEDKAIPIICEIFEKNYNEFYVAARQIVGYLNEYDLERLRQM